MSTIVSESGHFYSPTGEPCYTLIGRNGKERNSTTRDAKKNGWYPSVTEVTKVYPKPGLDAWKQRQSVMAALTLPRVAGESDDELVTRILADAKEQARKAAERGSEIHGCIERSITGQIVEIKLVEDYAQPALNALMDHLGFTEGLHAFMSACAAEKSFSNSIFSYGGKIDLHSRSLSFVCDFKTKDKIEDGKQLIWDEHKMQLAAYSALCDIPNARLINVFIGVQDKRVAVQELTKEEEEWGWSRFMACREFYRALKGI